ncbi:aldehyde dehydrogenase family protein [Yinghuangia aomiensis]|uniref:Aldehyde dehydrogenase family protein n=2 Tax=Yinghuangia aomiensis TaxID=676205 RepID=A0ABP9IGI0_9ACTN
MPNHSSPSASLLRSHVVSTIIPGLDLRPYIGDGFADPVGQQTIAVSDPMTRRTLTNMPEAGPEDVEAAVAAARAAFDTGPWPRMPARERAAALERLADGVERAAGTLALLEATDTGKVLAGVRAWDIPQAAAALRFYARQVLEADEIRVSATGDRSVRLTHVPVGVCAAVIPWNFPFACTAWKIAPILAAGCTVVVKSAERAPLSVQALAGLVVEAGFPPGVVNIVAGRGETTGWYLTADPRIDAVTFTGSTATARAVVGASLRRLPRTVLELGGKGSTLVFADCDVDDAVAGTLEAAFDCAGQSCCAGSRIFVHEALYGEFLERLVCGARTRRLGDPLDAATQQGPQIDDAHLGRIDAYVREAVAGGARCATGGGRPTPDALFYAPTFVTGASRDARISREEIFGPVACVYPFADLGEALHAANDTDFGLSASVWTSNPETARKAATGLQVGTCWINGFGSFDPNVPWGGTKLSGRGRELGAVGLHEFLDTKAVWDLMPSQSEPAEEPARLPPHG